MIARLNILGFFKRIRPQAPRKDLAGLFRAKYDQFKQLLDSNAELSKIITDIEEKLTGHQIFGMAYVRSQSARAVFYTLRMVSSLNALSGARYRRLLEVVDEINGRIKGILEDRKEIELKDWVLPYSSITKDMVDWVGGKNANLGEVLNRVRLPIPEGFAITTVAFNHFMTANDLTDEIDKQKMALDPANPESVNMASEEIQRLIISAPVPEELAQAILDAYDAMMKRLRARNDRDTEIQVSLRSSAIGEDSELSFAGQYLSVLNVPRDRLVQTYKFIIASLYTPRAISYRLSKGIRDEDIAMSVACLEMIESVASGVVYSHHPFNPDEDRILINGVWGLGPYAVDGVVTPDSFTVCKGADPRIVERCLSCKPVQLVTNPQGGLIEMPVPGDMQECSCLSDVQACALAGFAQRLEEHYGHPQDMEWALDRDGRLFVLQTRPLHVEGSGASGPIPRPIVGSGPAPIIENAAIAAPGVGCGPAYQVTSDEGLSEFPEGAVLVARHSSPKFVVVMGKAQAIIADSGSVTGHMASLSREFGVPTLLNARNAMASIPTGMEVTVDGFTGRVYPGRVEELLVYQKPRETHMKGTPVYGTLKQIAEAIVPLRLVDPKSATFNAEHCKSLHDVMRLVHELSYSEMFQISDVVSAEEGHAVRLDAPIPLDLRVIDLGGGLDNVRPNARKIKVKQVASAPFKALLKGMLMEELRYHRPRPVEIGGFLSVMSEQMLTNTYGAERFGDRSYAIVSDKYLNFSSRVGYHYGILDSYCGQTINKNYVSFSFKGGAADDVRRNRRARAIALILKELGFSVEVMGDRVDAKFQKYPAEEIEEKLDHLGRLLLFTRQMDMLMHSEASVTAIARAFLAGDYGLEGKAGPEAAAPVTRELPT
ncbi:MAG: PEP-utilizing enzyme [Syntrophobacteraceae bacterium]|jgi:pyruvate,water dikinase|nr:PEP-utilizing enzyme [Syntrophobacteraceae bacterium]